MTSFNRGQVILKRRERKPPVLLFIFLSTFLRFVYNKCNLINQFKFILMAITSISNEYLFVYDFFLKTTHFKIIFVEADSCFIPKHKEVSLYIAFMMSSCLLYFFH